MNKRNDFYKYRAIKVNRFYYIMATDNLVVQKRHHNHFSKLLSWHRKKSYIQFLCTIKTAETFIAKTQILVSRMKPSFHTKIKIERK